jgi:hypothetical protein
MRLKLLFSIAFILLFCGAFAQNYNNKVTVYKDCGFKGPAQSFGEGWYTVDQLGIGNDDISSIWVPKGWVIIVYEDDKFLGRKKWFKNSVDCLPEEWNDKISSIHIKRDNSFDNYNEGEVVVYEDCGFRGQRSVLTEGSFRNYQLGIGNDEISSIRIPIGWTVTVYEHDNFQGQSQSFTGNTDCLPPNWNDRISSIRVSKRNQYNNYNNNSNNYSNNDDQVVVYRDCYFKSVSKAFGEGNFRHDELGVGNDKMSSLKIPRGWLVTVYENDNFDGASRVFTHDVDCVPQDWNDRISSMRISRLVNYYSNNPVVVYRDCNYRSESQSFTEGWYRDYQLGVGNDKISSLKIPWGWTVTVYQDDNYKGASITYTGNIDCLPPEWNDKISSMHIMRNR